MYKTIDIFESHRLNSQIKSNRFGNHADKIKRLNGHPSAFLKNDHFQIINGKQPPRIGSIHYK
jgi:hypothetical protein